MPPQRQRHLGGEQERHLGVGAGDGVDPAQRELLLGARQRRQRRGQRPGRAVRSERPDQKLIKLGLDLGDGKGLESHG